MIRLTKSEVIAMGVIIAALAASQAHAVDRLQPQRNVAAAGAVSTAVAWSRSGAHSVSQGGAGGTASIVFNQPGAVSYDFTGGVQSVPAVFAPALAGGNNCAMSASFGGSVLGFGISGGVGYESEPCNVRQEAALLHNMGEGRAAVEHLKRHIPRIAETFEALGGE